MSAIVVKDIGWDGFDADGLVSLIRGLMELNALLWRLGLLWIQF